MPGFGLPLAISAAAAVRAASLDLCADEYLLALARPAEIASVSRLASDPADSAWWRRARGIPANRGQVEQVIAQRPTLLVSMGGGGRARAAVSKALGLRSLILPYPSSPDAVASNLSLVASALGEPRRALSWRKRLVALQATPQPLRDAIFLSGGGDSLSAGSLGASWMALAGMRQRSILGGRVSLEQLAMNPPAILLQSAYRRGEVSLGQRWLDHPLVVRTPSKRIWADGRRWTCGGPPMLEEIERLRLVR